MPRATSSGFFKIGPRSDHCPALSVTQSKFCEAWYCVHNICHSCYMDLSKLLQGYVKVVTCICQSSNMSLSKLIYVFVKLPNQAKLWPVFRSPSFCCWTKPTMFVENTNFATFWFDVNIIIQWSSSNSELKVVLSSKHWRVKALKSSQCLGPLCIWQCFINSS